jgi:hypothetical protein
VREKVRSVGSKDVHELRGSGNPQIAVCTFHYADDFWLPGRAPPASGAAKPRRPNPRMSRGLLHTLSEAGDITHFSAVA